MIRLTEEDIKKVDAFITEVQGLPDEEILAQLHSMFGSFAQKPKNQTELTFFQLEQDIEIFLRLVREYLVERVFMKDISDVSLENLEKALLLMTSEKRRVTNIFYEGLFNIFRKQNPTKTEKKLIKEADERLKLFFEFQKSIKEIVEVYIHIKKLFASVTLSEPPKFHELSFLPMFDDLINEGINVVTEQIESLTPAMTRPQLLDNSTYKRIMDLYTSELEMDIVQLEQVARWKKVAQNQAQQAYLVKIERKVIELQRMHRGVILIAYGSKHHLDMKLLLVREQTYSLEKMIDRFK